MEKIKSFAPVTGKEPRVLILGSVPSVKSLDKQEYYGNPRNHFWSILAELFQREAFQHYDEKVKFIIEHHLALWDSVQACERVGSLDMNIQTELPNDILKFLKAYPTIKLIVCNGTKSYQVLKKYFGEELINQVKVIKVPSSSPIPGKYNKNFSEKVVAWRELLAYLKE